MTSDKHYWHRYTEFYGMHFSRMSSNFGRMSPKKVLEYGVLNGDSLRYIHEWWPEAKIVGADIMSQQDSWPTEAQYSYKQVDQGDRKALGKMLKTLGSIDLVIEDGSHLPEHQRNCLVETLPYVSDGGLYILEDLHTSHILRVNGPVNCYGLLLAIEHHLATEKKVSADTVNRLSTNSLFTAEEVEYLFKVVTEVALYQRATLPLECYRCHSSNFNYETVSCECGLRFNRDADSMAAVLTIKN